MSACEWIVFVADDHENWTRYDVPEATSHEGAALKVAEERGEAGYFLTVATSLAFEWNVLPARAFRAEHIGGGNKS